MLAAAGGAWILLGLRSANAAALRGTVSLPAELRSTRRHLGYWRVENGNVAIISVPYRAQTMVVLAGFKGAPPPAKTVTVEITGLQATSPLVVVGPGSVVEFRNGDRVAHDLGVPDQPQVMAVERLAAGNMRRVRFAQPGGHLVRCAEYPHIAVSVVVMDGPHFALVDDKGVFRFTDVPEGKGTLKVWSQGRWVHEEPLEVGGRPLELAVAVSGGGGREAAE
jgi:plastocyanin